MYNICEVHLTCISAKDSISVTELGSFWIAFANHSEYHANQIISSRSHSDKFAGHRELERLGNSSQLAFQEHCCLLPRVTIARILSVCTFETAGKCFLNYFYSLRTYIAVTTDLIGLVDIAPHVIVKLVLFISKLGFRTSKKKYDMDKKLIKKSVCARD